MPQGAQNGDEHRLRNGAPTPERRNWNVAVTAPGIAPGKTQKRLHAFLSSASLAEIRTAPRDTAFPEPSLRTGGQSPFMRCQIVVLGVWPALSLEVFPGPLDQAICCANPLVGTRRLQFRKFTRVSARSNQCTPVHEPSRPRFVHSRELT